MTHGQVRTATSADQRLRDRLRAVMTKFARETSLKNRPPQRREPPTYREHITATWLSGRRQELNGDARTFRRKRSTRQKLFDDVGQGVRDTAQLTGPTVRYWLTRIDAAAHLRISVRTFDRRRSEGKYPPSGRSSSRRPLWSLEDLDGGIAKSNRPIDPIMALIDAED